MCQTVVFSKSNIECGNVRELKAILPDLKLVKNDNYETIEDDCCLCQIQLGETFDNAGMPYECNFMEYTLNA